jgi:GMP synthase (glutamine-hydrolysing)
MSHGDRIEDLPDGFAVLVRSANAPVAAMGNLERDIYALQFHPEVVHTDHGHEILRRLAVDVCGCTPDWAPASFIGQAVETIRDQVGDGHVVCGLGRGVDSSVTATLLHRALGEQRTASSSTLGYCARVSRNRSQALSEIGLACGS